MMKISLITTVLNEEKTIESFLDSVLKQTKLPDEIIICEAGSTDKTLQKIEKFHKDNSTLMIHIIRVKRANRARGRNEAIKKVGEEETIICVSDAGCVLDKKWIEKITKPFRSMRGVSQGVALLKPRCDIGGKATPLEMTDVVAGFYEPTYNNVFEKCLSCYTTYNKMNKNYLPSSRSLAFRKSAWQKVGGYPENLDYCEDLVFAKKLKDSGLKIEMAREAIVYWPQRKNLDEAFSQLSNYALGDFQAGYVPHLRKIALVYLRYIVGGIISFISIISIISLMGIYFIWAITKNYRYVKNRQAIFWLPVLQITADLAVMVGGLRWSLRKLKLKDF